MFEIDPDEIQIKFAVELDECRTVRIVEDAQGDVAGIQGRSEVVGGL